MIDFHSLYKVWFPVVHWFHFVHWFPVVHWFQVEETVSLVKRIEKTGVTAIAVHGR